MPPPGGAPLILTQCPSCRTLFQVGADTLESCGGAVRCGQCGAVFQAEVYRINETDSSAEGAALTAPRTWPLKALAGLLAILLTSQALYAARAFLARLPLTRPAIRTVCGYLPCNLSHPAALGRYRLRHPRVRLTATTGILSIRAQLVNGADFRQSLPLLSVTLLGPNGTVVGRTTFPPTLFLRHTHARLAAHAAATVVLNLHVPQTASGYRLSLFPTDEE